MKRENCEDVAMMIAAGGLWLCGLALVLAVPFGWVWNVVKLAGMNLDAVSGMLILRIVGVVVPPLGVVLGYV